MEEDLVQAAWAAYAGELRASRDLTTGLVSAALLTWSGSRL